MRIYHVREYLPSVTRACIYVMYCLCKDMRVWDGLYNPVRRVLITMWDSTFEIEHASSPVLVEKAIRMEVPCNI